MIALYIQVVPPPVPPPPPPGLAINNWILILMVVSILYGTKIIFQNKKNTNCKKQV